jgi:O-methyltransferase
MDKAPDTPPELYLDLLKRTLTNYVYGDVELRPAQPEGALKKWVVRMLRDNGIHAMWPWPFNPEKRRLGLDWPPTAHSMIGLDRLDNLQQCVETVLDDGVPGDFIETGVWRGGASIFMRGILKSRSITDRKVWVADSFEGLPPPDPDKYPADAGSKFHTWTQLAVSREEVERNFTRYGLLDDQVEFLQGWFKDTLPPAPIERLALIRLDGDLYESTMDALNSLYSRLSPGGYVIVDDYGAVENCRKAIHDFRDREGIEEALERTEWSAAYWRRSA